MYSVIRWMLSQIALPTSLINGSNIMARNWPENAKIPSVETQEKASLNGCPAGSKNWMIGLSESLPILDTH